MRVETIIPTQAVPQTDLPTESLPPPINPHIAPERAGQHIPRVAPATTYIPARPDVELSLSEARAYADAAERAWRLDRRIAPFTDDAASMAMAGNTSPYLEMLSILRSS